MSNQAYNVDTDPLSLFGLLSFDKPLGMTSRDVVNRVVWKLRELAPKPAPIPKVGHAGTLDPLASGVLLVGVGAGVRLVPYLHQQPKAYRATFRFGQSSESGDLEKPLVDEIDPSRPTDEELATAISELTGNITQIPPAHSAIKVGGRKAYKFAHKGQAVEVPSRVVRIDEIRVRRYEYPDIEVDIRCGTGTYIRTLGIDLAAKCGTTAVMTELVRTAIGEYSLADATPLERLGDTPLDRLLKPLAGAVAHLPSLHPPDEMIDSMAHGIKIAIDDLPATRGSAGGESSDDEAAVIDTRGNLRVIAKRRDGNWNPYRVFPRQT